MLESFTAVHYFLDGLVISLYHCQTLLTAMCEGRQLLQYSMTSRVLAIYSYLEALLFRLKDCSQKMINQKCLVSDISCNFFIYVSKSHSVKLVRYHIETALVTWHFCLKSTGPSESVVLVI